MDWSPILPIFHFMKKLFSLFISFILLLIVFVPKTYAQVDPPFYFPVGNYSYISTYYAFHHPGIDFVAPCYTPVRASMQGKVIYSGWDNTGYGYRVDVVNAESDDRALYGHLSAISVEYGTYITKGQNIGSVGSTGRSTGCHLH